jgi:menaquinol-cytochrome c reductase iron-sulfur subunit
MDTVTEKPADAKVAVPVGRRSFVMAMFAVSGTVVGALLAIPLFRFATFPLRKTESETDWSDIGPATEFASLTAPVAKTITLERRDAWQTTASQTAVYVLPAKDGVLQVLSPVCPHLGCSVQWQQAQDMFLCPCHGGTFSANGERLGGPPPRSMDTLESKVENGTLKVRYQYFRQLVSNKEPMA